jgi:hypothetical protein
MLQELELESTIRYFLHSKLQVNPFFLESNDSKLQTEPQMFTALNRRTMKNIYTLSISNYSSFDIFILKFDHLSYS